MTTVFVSGHLRLTGEEFHAHYVPKLERALARGCRFVVGDARGVDFMTQRWLARVRQERRVNVDVTVYHMFDAPRHNDGSFPTVGGFTSDLERDRAMTLASDEDIAWVRPGRESSGTALNIARRKR